MLDTSSIGPVLADKKGNKFPAGSFIVLAALTAALFSPSIIERTDTECSAVSAQVTNMMMAKVSPDEMARLVAMVPGHPSDQFARAYVQTGLREALTKQADAHLNLASEPWYKCSVLYWVNYFNPLPPAP